MGDLQTLQSGVGVVHIIDLCPEKSRFAKDNSACFRVRVRVRFRVRVRVKS